MKFIPGKSLTENEMVAKAEEAVANLEAEYIKLFGQVPMGDDIAWVCSSADKCGWWDDSTEMVEIAEREYLDKQNGIIRPAHRFEVQMRCPDCQARIMGVRKQIYLDTAREMGALSKVLGKRRKRLYLV